MAIEYRITLDDNHQFSYRIELDRVYEAEAAQSAPAWTRLEYQQCSNCPLSKDNFSHCPAAVDLHRVIEDFQACRHSRRWLCGCVRLSASTTSRWAWKRACVRCSG